MTTALCPGSFDPPTNGHIDVIERASHHFARLVVAVVANPSKHSLFAAEERVALLTDALAHLDNVEVASFDGLLVDYARQRGIGVVLKGVRAVSDFDYEFQLAGMNRHLMPEVETVFLTPSDKYQFISSTFVREIAVLGGEVHQFVSATVQQRLIDKVKSLGRD